MHKQQSIQGRSQQREQWCGWINTQRHSCLNGSEEECGDRIDLSVTYTSVSKRSHVTSPYSVSSSGSLINHIDAAEVERLGVRRGSVSKLCSVQK